MFLGPDGTYSAFEELMYYFDIQFSVYYILTLIVAMNCIKVVVNYVFIRKGKKAKFSSSVFDLITSMLAGIGLGTGMLFQGVLADVSFKHFEIWGDKLLLLCIVSLVLFIIQFIFVFKIKTKEK